MISGHQASPDFHNESKAQKMRIFLLGATGDSGRRILTSALERGHHVTAFVRDPSKLLRIAAPLAQDRLTIVAGNIEQPATLAPVLPGHDVVINAAGHVSQGNQFTRLVQIAIQQTAHNLGYGARFWQFGGAAVLDIPGTDLKGVDLPLVPRVYEAHRTNFNALVSSSLDWSMLCPGPMIDAPNGKPTRGLRLLPDSWPPGEAVFDRHSPETTMALAFRDTLPELTISYEDAASVILDNLERNGRFCRRRVCVALPVGMRNFKVSVPE